MVVEMPLIAPMLVQAGLTLLVSFWLVWARVGSVARGKVDMRDVAKNGWKGWIKQAGDNYANQFEAPILFFVLCIIMTFIDLSTRVHSIGPVFRMVAWAFVFSRVVHAIVHLSFNHILIRFLVFFVGVLCLLAMFMLTVDTFLNLKEYDIYRDFGV